MAGAGRWARSRSGTTVAISLAAALALAACDATSGGRIRSIPILDGAVTAAAPAGYCISPGAGMRGEDSAVLLMGRCSDGPGVTAAPAVLTLSVGPAGSAGVMAGGGAALADYFKSEAGRAALSRKGRAADVRVLYAAGSDGRFILHIEDRASGDYWRGIAGVRGRLATISVAGASDAPLSAEDGRGLLEAALLALGAANRSTQAAGG